MASYLWLIVLVSLAETHGSILHRSVVNVHIKKTYSMIEDMVNKSKTLENNIMNAAVKMAYNMNGGPTERVMSFWADDTALEKAKVAFLLAKSTSSILTQCKISGINNERCLNDMISVRAFTEKLVECDEEKYRRPSGECNNKDHPALGSAYSPYSRILKSSFYQDEVWWSHFENNKIYPSPLNMSASLLDIMESDLPDITFGFSAWSKLVSHDLGHTGSYRAFFTKENIKCCHNENRILPRYRHPFCFYMGGRDDTCVSYARSMLAVPLENQFGSAEQMNTVSQFLDASVVYGSSENVENALRAHEGGLLKESSTEYNEHLNCVEKNKCFLTGDLRNLLDPSSAIGNVMLVKEHNRIARVLSELNPFWDDEKLFLEAKRVLIAEVQHITYNEWLPLVLGKKKYAHENIHFITSTGFVGLYQPYTNPSVSNEFANAAIKPLTWLNEIYLRAYNKQRAMKHKRPLRHTVVNMKRLQNDTLLRGLGKGLTLKINEIPFMFSDKMIGVFFSEDTSNEQERSLALEIHRGRDHGLLPFPEYGDYLHLEQRISPKNLEIINKHYRNKNDIDLLVGGILEEKTKKSMVGSTFHEIILRQMIATRTGDRFFYDNPDQPHPFNHEQLDEIQKATFARLICDNFEINKIQLSAFLPSSKRNPLVLCSNEDKLKIVNLKYWQE